MSNNDSTPRLVELGANTRGAPSGINMDVSGTVGPDHLGQETVDVDGHPCDRPGVTSRAPENIPDSVEVSRMDTGEELPVLLSSSMSADPIEGVQGSYSQIVEGECPRCGYDRLKVTVVTMAGETQEQCNACGAKINHRADNGYTMPTTDKERVKKTRDAGEQIGTLTTNDVIDLEDHTGMGPYISLVGSRSQLRLRKDDVEELFWMLINNGDIDLEDTLSNNVTTFEHLNIVFEILPDGCKLHGPETDQEDDESP